MVSSRVGDERQRLRQSNDSRLAFTHQLARPGAAGCLTRGREAEPERRASRDEQCGPEGIHIRHRDRGFGGSSRRSVIPWAPACRRRLCPECDYACPWSQSRVPLAWAASEVLEVFGLSSRGICTVGRVQQ